MSHLRFAVAAPVLSSLLGVAAAVGLGQLGTSAQREPHPLVGEVCVDSALSASAIGAAESKANELGAPVRVRDCGVTQPQVTRLGYNPHRPELSVPSSAITRQETPGFPKTTVKVIPLDVPAAWDLATIVANGAAVAGFTCFKEHCTPSTVEVYVGAGDSAAVIQERLRLVLGER